MELAATRLIAMRKNKGKSIAACLNNHTSYIQNPDKTEQGELVSSYQCFAQFLEILHHKAHSSLRNVCVYRQSLVVSRP